METPRRTRSKLKTDSPAISIEPSAKQPPAPITEIASALEGVTSNGNAVKNDEEVVASSNSEEKETVASIGLESDPNIPETTVIIEEFKTEENITYKIRATDNEGEAEETTVVEVPIKGMREEVEDKPISKENGGKTEDDGGENERGKQVDEEKEKLSTESGSEALPSKKEAKAVPENAEIKPTEMEKETEPEPVKEHRLDVILAVNEQDENNNKGSLPEAKPRRSSRRGNTAFETVQKPLEKDAAPVTEPTTSSTPEVGLTKSKYGRVRKTKTPNPEMVAFNSTRRRRSSTTLNGEKNLESNSALEKPPVAVQVEANDSSAPHEVSVNSSEMFESQEKSPADDNEEQVDATPVSKAGGSTKPKGRLDKLIDQLKSKGPTEVTSSRTSRSGAKSRGGFATPKRKEPVLEDEGKRKVIEFPGHQRIIMTREELTTIPEKEGDHMVGDLLWSKLVGHPYWPCMVSIDPLLATYAKLGGRRKQDTVYHVQFFGPQPLRSWTNPGMIMPFEGKDKYDENLQQIKNSPTSQKRTKLVSKFGLKPKYKKDWEIAVKTAEDASQLNRVDRVNEYTFEYVQLEKTANKRRASETPQSGPNNSKRVKKESKKSSPEDVYDFDAEEEAEEETASPSLSFLLNKRTNQKGEFSVYSQREKSQMIAENPDSSELEIEEALKKRWALLSEDLKRQYVLRTALTSPRSPSKARMSTTKLPMKLFQKQKGKQTSARKPRVSTPRALKSTKKAKATATVGALEDVVEDEPMDTETGKWTDDESSLIIAEPNSKKRTPKSVTQKTPRQKVGVRVVMSSAKRRKQTTPKVSKGRTPKRPKKEPEPVAGDDDNKSLPESEVSLVLKAPANQSVAVDSSDETAASEDASSISEPETANEPLKWRACSSCFEEASDPVAAIQCNGICLRVFHKRCLSDFSEGSQYTCKECVTGIHPCFICKEHTSDVIKCKDANCGKFYHFSCLDKSFPSKKGLTEEEGFLCPLHFCLTCFTDHKSDKVHRSIKKRMVSCLKCPTAYHVLDSCFGAGSLSVTNRFIICPEHLVKTKPEKHINVNWCFSCNTGGSLVCCERCPAAFHVKCLDNEPTEKSFYCSDCTNRKQLHYNDIVWVKLGNYRWWPGKLIHPKQCPDNIMKLTWKHGEFPVYFFGSHDYYWIHRGRAFLFLEGDNLKAMHATATAKSIHKQFKLALVEALDAHKTWQQQSQETLTLKKPIPPPYTHIRSNKPVGKVQLQSGDDESHNSCDCDPATDPTPCSSDTDCLNRLLLFECNSTICPAGDKCCNQRFKKREYVKAKPFSTLHRGWGLKVLEDVKKGQFVIEYVGELIDEEECEKRLKKMFENNESNFYFLTIDKERIIDAGPKGNLARFMNHSCQPNCETQKWLVNGQTRVGLFAVCDIPAGSELTFNYNLDCRGNEKTKCGCGAKSCSGFI